MRPTRIQVLGLLLGLTAVGSTNPAQAQDTAAEGWRFTLHGAGELLPGGGKLRDGRGFGLGAGYSVLSLGAEYWRYQLTLYEAIDDDYEHTILWVFYPLVLGLNWELSFGPYLGYASTSDSGTDSICPRNAQTPKTSPKDYPQTIPLGFELGLGVDVWVR